MRLDVRSVRAALLLAGCVGFAGCASTGSVNPPAPQANTGYVDFHTASETNLSWQVKRADGRTGEMRTVYSEFKPLEGKVLRLAAPPGEYVYQVWFMNQSTEGPQTVQVKVIESKVTPVLVTLTTTGTRIVKQETYGYHASVRGYNRGTKTTSDLNEVYRIGAVAQAPRDYEPLERMGY